MTPQSLGDHDSPPQFHMQYTSPKFRMQFPLHSFNI